MSFPVCLSRRGFLSQCAALAGAGLVPALRPAEVLAAQAPAPLFSQSFSDLDGRQVAMSQWLGKPIVANFWATWCAPCVKEMPDLEKLRAGHPGVQFLGLGVDTAGNMRTFLEKVHVSYPLLVLGYGGVSTMRALGNTKGGLPFTAVFDSQGNVARTILGPVDPADLSATLGGLSG